MDSIAAVYGSTRRCAGLKMSHQVRATTIDPGLRAEFGREPRSKQPVGVLTPFTANDAEGQNRVTAFAQALQQLGWAGRAEYSSPVSLGRRHERHHAETRGRTGCARAGRHTCGFQRNEIRRIGPHQIHVVRRPTLVELNIPALGPSQPCQFLPQSPNVRLRIRVTFRVGHQDTNPPHLTGLLPPRRERPSSRTAERGYQFPPSNGDWHVPLSV
jgi:hypothetical protein